MFLSVCLCVCADGLPYHKSEQWLGWLEPKCNPVNMNIVKNRDERRGLLLWACNVRTMLHSIACIYITSIIKALGAALISTVSV